MVAANKASLEDFNVSLLSLFLFRLIAEFLNCAHFLSAQLVSGW